MASAAAAKKRPAWAAALTALLALLVWWFLPADEAPDQPGAATPPAATTSSPAASSPAASSPESPSRAAAVDEHGFAWIDDERIPDPGDEVLDAIEDGGPFEYEPHDGSVFGNREGLLPPRERGYYREYTVETPGLGHRGARRIVAGRGGEFYWTEDHYASFDRIRR